jgi:hypothetical protein
MIGKKINQLATELAPDSTDLTIIGDPISGVSKKITLAQLGAIFSGAVSFYTDLASFPATGDINVIYCAKDTQKLYLWSGSAYVEVFPSQALLDTYQLRSEKGNANGYASLDSGGKVPISQLPSSIMEYKGTWNAATNTPTLANGTGDTGDVYICNVAGTVNFGAGPLTFAVGDYVIYSGSIWQRSSGAVGTVTSVALTVGGDAISVSGSPLTTSGTLALAFSGTTSQYIRGNGTLANFPTSLVTGSGTTNFVSKFTTSSTIGSSQIYDDGTSVLIGTTGTLPNIKVGIYSSTQRALEIVSTNANALFVQSPAAFIMSISNGTWITQFTNTGRLDLAGDLLVNTIANATTDTDRFLVSDSGVIKYRTGAELLSDIGGASASGYVPYTGATANLDLGAFTLLAARGTFSSSGSSDTFGITHSSGSGIALNITKGGNGEGLYINKTSGSGNAATIIGTLNATTLVKSGGTSSQFLKADGSVDSTSYGTGSVTSVGLSSATSGVTIGSTPITTSGTITLAIATASGSQQGLLSSTDWTTFNNKQNALTNPVTGTGTTNYLPKFTGTSTIGNSQIFDNGTNVGIGTASPNAKLDIGSGDIYVRTGIVASNRFDTYNGGATQMFFGYPASGSVAFNNGSDRLILTNDGNLGLGVSPGTWGSSWRALEMKNGVSLWSYIGAGGSFPIMQLSTNATDVSGTTKYVVSSAATDYVQESGKHYWRTAPSGTAGNAISFTQAMTLDASGRLGIGTTSPDSRLHVGPSNGAQLRIDFVSSGDNYYDGVTHYFRNGNGAANIMTLLNGGNVGIGTSSPNTLLSLVGNHVSGQSILKVQSSTAYSASGLSSIGFNDADGTRKAIVYTNSDGLQLETGGSTQILFNPNGNEKMRLTSAGELCVGRTSAYGAGFLVNVQGNIYASAAIVAGSTIDAASRILAGGSSNTSNAFSGQNNSTAQATIYSYNHNASGWSIYSGQGINYFAGSVGIGTTAPTSKLHVVGLPTSSAGLTSGAIWNDGGTLKIV